MIVITSATLTVYRYQLLQMHVCFVCMYMCVRTSMCIGRYVGLFWLVCLFRTAKIITYTIHCYVDVTCLTQDDHTLTYKDSVTTYY